MKRWMFLLLVPLMWVLCPRAQVPSLSTFSTNQFTYTTNAPWVLLVKDGALLTNLVVLTSLTLNGDMITSWPTGGDSLWLTNTASGGMTNIDGTVSIDLSGNIAIGTNAPGDVPVPAGLTIVRDFTAGDPSAFVQVATESIGFQGKGYNLWGSYPNQAFTTMKLEDTNDVSLGTIFLYNYTLGTNLFQVISMYYGNNPYVVIDPSQDNGTEPFLFRSFNSITTNTLASFRDSDNSVAASITGSGNTTLAGTLTTGVPTGGNLAANLFGAVETGLTITANTTNAVRVEINGTKYWLMIANETP